MTKLDRYPTDHPAAIALAGMARALRSGTALLDGLAEQARRVGVEPWSADFDEAAKLMGFFYSRAWDAYVSREDLALAERLPLAHMN